MQKRIVELSQEKFDKIDFSQFKMVRKTVLRHHDTPLLAMMQFPYNQRKEVPSGLYYKSGYIIEVLNFKGKASVVCKELYKAQCEAYE